MYNNMGVIKNLYWKIGTLIYNQPTLRKYIKPLYRKIVISRENNSKNDLFRKNGLKVIKEFDEILTDNSIPYILFFGSLLGAIREKGFIKHDLDIDVAIWNEDYSKIIKEILERAGFKLTKNILVEDGRFAREETYEKDGIGIDIFYIYPYSEKEGYVCCFRNYPNSINFEHSIAKFGGLYSVQYYFPIEKKIKRILFENALLLPIPSNAHDIMKCIYGASYMTPQPKREAGSFREYQNLLFDKVGIYTEFN